MPNLTAYTRNGSGDVVVTLHGEIDLATAQELEDALRQGLEEARRRLVVDLRALQFVDSTGLSVLMRLDRHARDSARQLVVVKGPPEIQRVFDITGVSDMLTMVDEPPAEGD
jgi:anti-anti-sigma factor